MEVWPFYKADKPTSKYSLLTARPGVSLSDDSLDKLAALFPDHQWPHEIHLTYDEEGLTAVEPDTCVGIVVSAGRHAWLANHLQQHRDDHDGVVLFHPHRISDLGMPVCVVVPTHEVDEYVAAVDAATAMWPEGCRPVVIGFHATDGAGAAFPSGFGVQRHCVLAVWRRLLGCELVAVTLDDSIAFLRTGDAVDHSGAAALAEKAKAGDDRVMTACPASANKFSANNVAKFQKLTTPEVVNNLHKMSADYQLDLNMDLPQQAVAWRAVGGFAPDADPYPCNFQPLYRGGKEDKALHFILKQNYVAGSVFMMEKGLVLKLDPDADLGTGADPAVTPAAAPAGPESLRIYEHATGDDVVALGSQFGEDWKVRRCYSQLLYAATKAATAEKVKELHCKKPATIILSPMSQ